MSDSDNTEAGLREEVGALRARVAALESERATWMQADESLRESAEQFQTLFENAPLGIYSTTPDGRILNANPALVKMLGYSSFEELAARNLEEEGFEPQYPRSEFCEHMELEGGVGGMEAAWKRRDGSVIFVRENAKAIRGTDGQIMYYEGTVEDVTEAKRAEKALRASEERFRAIAESIPGLVFSYDFHPDGRRSLLYVGPGLGELIGETAAVEIGDDVDRFHDLIHPADREALRETSDAAAAAGHPFDLNYRVRTESGDYRWVRSIARPIRRSDDVTRWHGVLVDISAQMQAEAALREAHDQLEQRVVQRTADLTAANRRLQAEITERKRAEEAIRRSERHFRDVIDGLGPHMFVGVMSIDGVLLEANQPGLGVADLKAEDVLGKPCEETYWFAYSETVKRQLREDIRRAARGETCRHDMVVRVGENDFIDIDFCLNPLRDESGEITHLIPSAIVITERKRAEEDLRKSRDRFQSLFEDSPVLLREMDMTDVLAHLQGLRERDVGDLRAYFDDHPEEVLRCARMARIVDINRASVEFYGARSKEELIERIDETLAAPGQSDRIKEQLIALSEGNIPSPLDAIVKTLSGEQRYLSVHLSVSGWAQSGLSTVIYASMDVSERKQAEETQQQLAAILEGTPDLVGMANPEGRVLMINPAGRRMCEIGEHEDLSNLAIADLHPEPATRLILKTGIPTAMREGTWEGENELLTRGGRTIPVSQVIIVHKTAGGSAEYLSTVMRDITQRKAAERALREGEARLRQVIDLVPHQIFAKDREGGFLMVNKAVANVYGTTVDELVGRFHRAVHKPEAEISHMLADDQEVIDSGVPKFVPAEDFTDCNGNVRILQTTKVPFIESGSDTPAALGIAIDITERKRAEEELRGQQELLSNVLSNIPHSVFWKDRDSVYLGCNQNFTREAGVQTPQEVIGKTDYDLAWKKEETEFYRQCDREVMERGEPLLNIEEPQLQADGREATLLTSKVPLRDQAGQVVGILGIYADITERKRVEAALRRQSLVFESITDGVIITNLDGKITDWNPGAERIFGYSKAEVIGKSPEILNKPEEAKLITDRLTRGLMEDGHWSEEVNIIRKDGTEGICEAFLVHLSDEDGKCVGTVSVNRDITVRRQAEEEANSLQTQLHQAQKLEAVGTLASGIAHDFSNLLTAIFGYTELAKSSLPEEHPAIQALQMVEESARQARGVTNSLLTFTRKDVASKAPVNAVEAVRDSLNLLRRVLPTSIHVDEDLPTDSEIWINADATQLQQVLMNLAINARDAMPNGGRMGVLLRLDPPESKGSGSRVQGLAEDAGRRPTAILQVRDSGVGMPPEVSSRIFEPFFTTKAHGRGTGLGMSVIHAILANHDGQIDVASEPGRGTCITIRLPTCPPGVRPTGSGAGEQQDRGEGEVILIVEENDHVRSIMTSTLRSRGYKVLAAGSGAEARTTLDANIDIIRAVVLDTDLPDASRLWLTPDAGTMQADIRLICVAGEGFDEAMSCRMSHDVLLRKPFRMASLADAVAKALSNPEDTQHDD